MFSDLFGDRMENPRSLFPSLDAFYDRSYSLAFRIQYLFKRDRPYAWVARAQTVL
jgi:hypothetical protein